MKLTWQYRVWISVIVVSAVGLVIYFSVLSIQDMGHSIVIMTSEQYQNSLK